MLRAIMTASLLLATAGLTGCAAEGGGGKNSGSSTASFDEMTPTQIAAWSATSKYPTTTQTTKPALFVLVNQSKNTIKVFNFTGVPVRNAKLWVNKTFVAKIDGIAPNAPVLIKTDRLYDSVGNVFAKQTLEVSAVQLETEEGLFDLYGPASE